jgi:hypothetical protein
MPNGKILIKPKNKNDFIKKFMANSWLFITLHYNNYNLILGWLAIGMEDYETTPVSVYSMNSKKELKEMLPKIGN